jgi:predicted Fe-S protein YdhL (DUF1289 family)
VNNPEPIKRPESPCIDLCTMDDEDRYCLGCHRTLDEIALWSSFDQEEKDYIWQLLEERANLKNK